MQKHIIHPDTHAKFISSTKDFFHFEDGSELPVFNGIPVLFSKQSMFCYEDICKAKVTTQNGAHLDTSNLKNYIRRKMLPALCADFNMDQRYAELAKKLDKGSKVLIVGVGEKATYYKNIFSDCEVITTDVHATFKPDYIFDGHYIPFENACFDLVLAAQVIEHTLHPWLFCEELQRVTKINGFLQIEAPQSFPYHAEPYDFFRFTFTGMRSLFRECAVVTSEITEGNAANVAVTVSNFFINTSSTRWIRSAWLFVTRLTLGWMKYLDRPKVSLTRRSVSMPKGYAFTFQKDSQPRSSKDLLTEFYQLRK